MHTGDTLAGRYELRERISRGAMGEVWHAFDLRLERDIAIKRSFGDPDAPPLLAEGRAAAMLDHPNIVAVHDAGTHEGEPFIVMEYVAGPSLRTLLQQRGALSESRAAAIAIDILAALDYAHRRGVWHNDVKPENILVGRSGEARLTDFGVASFNAPTVDVTASTPRFATVAYAPPEVLAGGPAGPAADLYALAVVLYECLSGVVPRRDAQMSVPRLREYAPGASTSLEQLLSRALATDPSDRFLTPAAFREALRGATSARHPTARLAPADPPRPSRMPWRPVALGALVIGLLGIGAAAGWNAGLPPSDETIPAVGIPIGARDVGRPGPAGNEAVAIGPENGATTLYLHNTEGPLGDSAARLEMPLTDEPGPDEALPNYDTDRDNRPGRAMYPAPAASPRTDAARTATWRGAPAAVLDFSSGYEVTVTFWFAGASWEAGSEARFDVILRALNSSGQTVATCRGSRDVASPGGADRWAPLQVGFPCTGASGDVGPEGELLLRIAVDEHSRTGSADAMMIAYGTTDYDAQLQLAPAEPGAPPPAVAVPREAGGPNPDTVRRGDGATDESPARGPDDIVDRSPVGPGEPAEPRGEAESPGILDRAWEGVTGMGRALRDGLEFLRP